MWSITTDVYTTLSLSLWRNTLYSLTHEFFENEEVVTGLTPRTHVLWIFWSPSPLKFPLICTYLSFCFCEAKMADSSFKFSFLIHLNYSSLLNLLSLQIVLFQFYSSSKALFCSLYSLYIGRTKALHFGSIRSNLVLFCPFYLLWSCSVHMVHLVIFAQLCPLWSYSAHSVLFGELWFYLVQFGLFRSYSVHFLHFSPIQSLLVLSSHILSTSVQFGSILSIRSYLVHSVYFDFIWFIQSYSIHWFYSVHFGSIQSPFVIILSYSVQACPIRSYLVYLVLFGPFSPLWSIQSPFVIFCPLRSNSIHSLHFGSLWSIRPISMHLHNRKRQIYVKKINSLSSILTNIIYYIN